MQGEIKEIIKEIVHSVIVFPLDVCKEILMLVYCTIGLTGAFPILSVGMKESSFMVGIQMSYQESIQYKELVQNLIPQLMLIIMMLALFVLIFHYMSIYINQSGMGRRVIALFFASVIVSFILKLSNAAWRNMFSLILFCTVYIFTHDVCSKLFKKKSNRVIYTDDQLMGIGVIPIICRECMKIINGMAFFVGIWLLFKNPINKEYVLGANSGVFIFTVTVIVAGIYQLKYSIRGQWHKILFITIASLAILIVNLITVNSWKYILILYLICFLCRVLSCMIRVGRELFKISRNIFIEKKRKKWIIMLERHDNIKKTYCPVVFGQSRQGRVHCLEVVVFSERYILDNHLNNNNWLRQHGFPMIRKGHPLYMECKRCKGRAASKIIISDPKQD